MRRTPFFRYMLSYICLSKTKDTHLNSAKCKHVTVRFDIIWTTTFIVRYYRRFYGDNVVVRSAGNPYNHFKSPAVWWRHEINNDVRRVDNNGHFVLSVVFQSVGIFFSYILYEYAGHILIHVDVILYRTPCIYNSYSESLRYFGLSVVCLLKSDDRNQNCVILTTA